MKWFSGYSILYAAATVLATVHDRVPYPWMLIVSDVCYISTYLLLYLSISQLSGRDRPRWQLQGSLVALAAVSMVYYGYLHPDTDTRVILFSLVLGLQETQIALLLSRRSDPESQSAGTPLASMLIALAILNLVRILGLASHGRFGEMFYSYSFRALLEMVNSCLQCGTVVAYVWMTASLLRHNLQLQATTDPLTGLMNRRAIDRFAVRTLAAERHGYPETSLITLDIDGFKTINDTLGHSCGDQALVQVAACLVHQLRPNDLIARLGGDEFAVLLPRTTADRAFEIAERLRVAIATLEIRWEQTTALPAPEPAPRVTASFGVAESRENATTWDHLVTVCDRALYAAKRAGGNRVVRATALEQTLAIAVQQANATDASSESAMTQRA